MVELLRSSNSAVARKYGGVREWLVRSFAIYFLDLLGTFGSSQKYHKKAILFSVGE
ncbi:MAG TPA: hypothetical protein PLC90_13595 [Bacteroidales bacterium]|nr:hypothetical protein [Bacteroidales bacterium]HNZ43907.1 hypothetical protein [Bacteroidales bacterium]HPB26559.1 hypothetical protein [Bacteroidales bacterium]HPI31231.1 hypothetical protein [Bacteroidales bacterium]HQN17373.1 hypothetical protein [Bacteroidales bacterium]